HLFTKELPIRYIGLLNRVSDREADQKLVSGCPYGIIYRLSFNEYAHSHAEEASKEELVTIICSWNLPHWTDWVNHGILDRPADENEWKNNISKAYEAGIEQLQKKGIGSIQDLKKFRIFNAELL